jgi:hypothetical protein
MHLMTALVAFAAMSLAAADAGVPWEEAAKDNGITIFSREVPGSDVREMKAQGTIDARPDEVWKVIRDYPNYMKTMPYMADCRVLGKEDGDKVQYVYSRLDLPMVDNRDYVLKILDVSDWQDGKGFMKTTWSGFEAPKGDPRHVDSPKGAVRTPVNDGYWTLQAQDNGNKTWAVYYVHSDPGGSVPRFIANKANSTAVPNVFTAIRKAVAEGRAKAGGADKK